MSTIIIETQTQKFTRLLESLLVLMEVEKVTKLDVTQKDPFEELTAEEYKAAFLNQKNKGVV